MSNETKAGPYTVTPKTGKNTIPVIARIDGPNYRSEWMVLWQANEQAIAMNTAHAHAAGQASREHLSDANIDTMASFIAGQLDNDGHHNRYDAAKKALTMYRDHILPQPPQNP